MSEDAVPLALPLWDVDPVASQARLLTRRGDTDTLQAVFPGVSGRISMHHRHLHLTSGVVRVDVTGASVVGGEFVDRLPWRSWIDRSAPWVEFTVNTVRPDSTTALFVTGTLRYRGATRPAWIDVAVSPADGDPELVALRTGVAQIALARSELPLPRTLWLTPVGRVLPEAAVIVVDLVVVRSAVAPADETLPTFGTPDGVADVHPS